MAWRCLRNDLEYFHHAQLHIWWRFFLYGIEYIGKSSKKAKNRKTKSDSQNQNGKNPTKIQVDKIHLGTHGQTSGHSATQNRTKSIMNKHKVNHHRKSDTKNRKQRTISKLQPGTVSNESIKFQGIENKLCLKYVLGPFLRKLGAHLHGLDLEPLPLVQRKQTRKYCLRKFIKPSVQNLYDDNSRS